MVGGDYHGYRGMVFPRLQSTSVSDKRRRVMPYVCKFYIFLFVGPVVTFAIAVQLAPLGLFVNLSLAFSAACLWIIIGRWVFNKPDGL
jgi:hypothetical protein